MSCTLVQHRSARRDILGIIDRISDDNPAAAAAVYDAYEYTLELLKTTPALGRRYQSDNPKLTDIRVLPIHRYRNYLIFYRYSGEHVAVLHIWHGARDIAALLSDLE